MSETIESNWIEIDKDIIKCKELNDCFFEDNFILSDKIKQIDHLSDSKEYIECLGKFFVLIHF